MGRDYVVIYRIVAYQRPSINDPQKPGLYISPEPHFEFYTFQAENQKEASHKAREGKSQFNERFWNPQVDIELLVKGKVVSKDDKSCIKEVSIEDRVTR